MSNISIEDLIEVIKNYNPEEVDIVRKTYEFASELHKGQKRQSGDTTFFTNVTKDGQNIGIDTMSDVGFGLERIRWCLSNESYFNLYSDSKEIEPEVKAYLSVLALLTVNDVKPSNKNSGYRARLFSKKLVRY